MSDPKSTDPSSSFIPAPPFDDPGADVILRSSDGIDFRVHRLVLSLASPFFKQMFSLPQPTAEPEVPTIPVTESAAALDRALRFWYPGAGPAVDQTLDELRETLESLIMKYDVQSIVPFAKKELRGYLDKDAVAVYAIAWRHQWKDLAREAAKKTLTIPLRDFALARRSQLNYITGDAYHTLLHYHFQCGKIATLASSSLKWTTRIKIPGIGCKISEDICPFDDEQWEFEKGRKHPIPAWFVAYLKGLPAVLVTKPGARLNSPELVAVALKAVPQACSFCRTTGIERLLSFAVALGEHIAKQIDLVELKLDF
ncbi:hypothetical protein FB451DRAFT_1104358 [Mycena latifolia]|nr:hypothetical protein FB451DRAFT_1104358 [Mycena latifolia]